MTIGRTALLLRAWERASRMLLPSPVSTSQVLKPWNSSHRRFLKTRHESMAVISSLFKAAPQDCETPLEDVTFKLREILDRYKHHEEWWLRMNDPKEEPVKLIPVVQESKTMLDSYQAASLYPSQLKHSDKYADFNGCIRVGSIIEECDLFAAWVCYVYLHPDMKRSDMETLKELYTPYTIVTASIDRIHVNDGHVSCSHIILFEGCVTYTGNSSMEVTLQLRHRPPNASHEDSKLMMQAKFRMVCRDSKTGLAAKIVQLSPQNQLENEIFKLGQQGVERNKTKHTKSLFESSPTPMESTSLHKLYLDTVDKQRRYFENRRLPPGHVWMQTTRTTNLEITRPQFRNPFYKVYGGHLIRSAFEQAQASALLFSSHWPVPFACDDVIFRSPVDIGNVLMLSSAVVFTQGRHIVVRCLAEKLDTKLAIREPTNQYVFVFQCRSKGETVPVVVPWTYSECMMFATGKRHYEKILADQ